jgi:hypothetical protein
MERTQCGVNHDIVQRVRLFRDPYLLEPPGELFERYWYIIRLFVVKAPLTVSTTTIAAFITDWNGESEHCAQVTGVAYIDLHFLPDGTEKRVMLN